MVTVRICLKLKQLENRLFFTNKVGKNCHFVGVFNKTIVPLALVKHDMIIANLYATHTREIIVEYYTVFIRLTALGRVVQSWVNPGLVRDLNSDLKA